MTDIDYGKTIKLPQTDFPRRAGLAEKEPRLIARWQKMDFYHRQLKEQVDRPLFVLHDGPPYANGHIHMGHAMNKILKDVVIRSKNMQGFKTPYVPGYDCHGLPIEWKIEEKYRKAGRDKDDIDVVAFRRECRDFAQGWIDIQGEEFQRLGVNGDWQNPYVTMDYRAEALITGEIHKFAKNGGLYRGSKPVMWSVPEKTALAEAEVEYHDYTSQTAWIKFPIKTPSRELKDGYIVIWTTTPWTLPANRAIAYGQDIKYVGLAVRDVAEDSTAIIGDLLYVAETLAEDFVKQAKITAHDIVWAGTGDDFENMVCRHPLYEMGYDAIDVRVLPGDFVTTETGTGFVHCAPSHGEDDYKLGLKFGLDIPHTVGADGKYTNEAPGFEGLAVYTAEGKKGPANKVVLEKMHQAGALVAQGILRHSYPHSWRSKAPVIFRNTPQWFISMDANELRKKALAEIKKTRWVPAKGENRISAMVENRGDWCISRQRAWGVPIAVFVKKDSGDVLIDEDVNARILDIFEREGSDAWFARAPQDFLGDQYNADDFEQVRDIIDVWFESGSTHGFVCEDRDELDAPADLYLEGSDQHRGWFQSSLLVSTATRGHAPFKTVLTHGFLLDEKGYKMSKSGGNGMSPMELAAEYGADILRLWVVGSDYTSDLKVGPKILKGHVDIYLRIRNTLCFLLGTLNGFPEDGKIDYETLSDLDRYILHRLTEVDTALQSALKDFDLHKMVTTLHHFCNSDLSALYFDINKDNLYCNAQDSAPRRACQYVLNKVFHCLVRWLAPVLCFTAEEAFLSRKGLSFEDQTTSVHLETYPKIPKPWTNEAVKEKIEKLLDARRVVTGAIEVLRRDKTIRSSLEAKPVIYIADEKLRRLIDPATFADFVITSGIDVQAGPAPAGAFRLDDVPDVAVVIEKADGEKCDRCWKVLPDVGSDSRHPAICGRCADVVSHLPAEILASVA